ncbi:MAG: hypothetical protein M1839_003407 [Geoglossum umbratile]|nr:MAG: hypothetical protein M1839_003407 [Geoglossum umbratile]
MDHPKALFDGQKDVVILERAYHDVGGDLERAIDLVSHPDSGPSVTKAASLEPRLQRSRKRRRLSMSPAGMPPVAGHPQWTPALEQYERGKPRATPPSVEPVLPSTVDPKEELIVISDDEDSPTTLGNERPLGFDPMSPPAPAKSTQDECLSKALEVFPDISRDYVLKLYDEAADTPDLPEQLILQILDGGAKYPKETDSRKELKRKRQDDSDTVEINYEAADRGDATPLYTLQA